MDFGRLEFHRGAAAVRSADVVDTHEAALVDVAATAVHVSPAGAI